ncbi:MAG: Hpt domain-containing protein [Spirochaetales bacterium]|nr:Hpt domain-containing protein [Spirochaetales bacterium]
MVQIRSIQVKLISAILIILALSVFLSIYFTITNQKNNLLDASQQTLSMNTQVLNHTIRNIMLSGEAPLANRTMRDLREMDDFLEYDIYRRDGSLAFSNYETMDFVNNFQDDVMFEKTPRLDGSMINDTGFEEVLRFKTPLVTLDEEAMEMEYYFPILNYADCRTCHGDDHFIRGISYFRISLSDIYSKLNSAGTILTLFFLAVGFIIFFWMLVMVRRIIVKPVFSIGGVVSRVGGGDLDTRIDLNQKDEFGELAGQINEMILGLKKSKLLEIENTRIEARLEESRKYLDNINEGLLLLNPDFTITNEVSSFLNKLFEKENLAGLHFTDFIYGENKASEEQKQEMEMFLDFLFNNKTAALSMIMEINPVHDMHLILESGREIIINGEFQRIFDGEDVQNVMVLFQDMTDIVIAREALESEKMMRESELEQIAAILQHGPQVFEDFILAADGVYNLLIENIDNLGDEEILARVFRDTHSLKGTARYLKFQRLEKISHELEEKFAALRAGGDESNGTEGAPEISGEKELIEEMGSEIDIVRKIVKRFKNFSIEPESGDPELSIFKTRLSEMVSEIADELDKKIVLAFKSNIESIPGLRKLQPALFHLVRNAADHGIEDTFQRVAARKEESAVLTLSFIMSEGELRIEVKDDGQGLDFSAIEEKAVEKGILDAGSHSSAEILKAMFTSGFSSRDQVSTISGRGVGLDAVQADVHKLKGKITVRTKTGKGTSFLITIPTVELESTE